MTGLRNSIAELKAAEARIKAAAAKERDDVVAEVRGSGPSSPFFVMKMSELEGSDWSVERYSKDFQADILGKALDRPSVDGMIKAAAEVLKGWRYDNRYSFSDRTKKILAGSGIGECAAEAIARAEEERKKAEEEKAAAALAESLAVEGGE